MPNLKLKIVEQTPDRLVLASSRSLNYKLLDAFGTLLFFSSFVFGIPLFAAFLYAKARSNTGELTTLTCSRPETYVDCKLKREDAQGKIVLEQTLVRVGEVKAQEIQETRKVCDSDGDNCENKTFYTCRIRVSARSTTVPPLSPFLIQDAQNSCLSTSQATVEQIEQLIKGASKTKLRWDQDTRTGNLMAELRDTLLPLLMIGFPPIAVVGLVFGISIARIRSDIWTFDKRRNQFKLDRQYLGRKQILELPLNSINGVATDSSKLWLNQDKASAQTQLELERDSKLEDMTVSNWITPYLTSKFRYLDEGGYTLKQTSDRLTVQTYSEQIEIDHASNSLIYKATQGRDRQVKETKSYSQTEIEAVQVENGAPGAYGASTYEIRLRLIDDKHVTIFTDSYKLEATKKMAESIAQFLNVELKILVK